MNLAELETTLARSGWVALDLPDPSPVFAARDQLLAWLHDHALPGLARLDDYHRLVGDDARHIEIIHALALSYWESSLGRAVIAANLDLFRHLVGLDLHIQHYPYLRVVRPGRPEDAAPLHRDTYYGASPYEVSVIVPLTDMDGDSSVRVLTGSHLAPDSDYPYVQTVSPDVVIRSPRHQLGYPYAPRVLDPALAKLAEPVPLVVGQALLFGLSLVHGGGVNEGTRTRFSTDIRVANSLAPVAWGRGVHADYFVPLCRSAVSRTAEAFIEANRIAVAPRPQAEEGA